MPRRIQRRRSKGWRKPAGAVDLDEIRGHDLMCWCSLDAEWCHAEELLARANQCSG